LRPRTNPASNIRTATPAATNHHGAELLPVASAGVDEAGVEAAGAAGAAEVAEAAEVLGVVGGAGVVVGVVTPGDALAAVKENVPVTGWPSAEVARHATVYLPAGEPGRTLWVMVVLTSVGLPV